MSKSSWLPYSMLNIQLVKHSMLIQDKYFMFSKLCFYHSSIIPRTEKAFHNSIDDVPQIWCKFNKTKNFSALGTHRWQQPSASPMLSYSHCRDRPPRQSVTIFYLSFHISQHTKHSPTPYANIFQLEMSNVQRRRRVPFPTSFNCSALLAIYVYLKHPST